MSGVPRSQKLLGWLSQAAGISPIWTTPDAHITLLKSCYVYQAGVAAAAVSLEVSQAGLGTSLIVHSWTLEVAGHDSWEGWIVLNPGDVAWVRTDVAGLVGWMSGAVLAGAPLFPPATRALPTQEPHR